MENSRDDYIPQGIDQKDFFIFRIKKKKKKYGIFS